jgi:hypothetical protein
LAASVSRRRGWDEKRASGSRRYESFSVSVVAAEGSGRYINIHGHTGFYGTFDREDYTFVIQTTGTLSY